MDEDHVSSRQSCLYLLQLLIIGLLFRFHKLRCGEKLAYMTVDLMIAPLLR